MNVSSPYIYVTTPNSTNKPVRLLLPNDFDRLKQKAQVALKIHDEISHFISKSGDIILYINEVIPGDTLYVATQPPPEIIDLSSSEMNLELPDNKIEEEEDEEEENFSNQELKSESIENHFEEEESDVPLTENSIQEIHNEEEEEEEHFNFEPAEQNQSQSVHEETQSLRESQISNRSESASVISRSSLSQASNISDVVEKTILGPSITNPVAKTFTMKTIDTRFKQVFKECDKTILDGQRKFFKSALKILPGNAMLQKKNSITLLPQIEDRISAFLDKHRVIYEGTTSYTFSTLVGGPNHSGKSLLLSIFLENFIADLVTSHTAQENFVFVFDAVQLAAHATSLETFMTNYIETTFTQISWQRTGFSKFCKSVTNYFASIFCMPEETLPTLPHLFTKDEYFKTAAKKLFSLAQRIHEIAFSNGDVDDWQTTLMLFPSLVAECFGFKKTHFIIDNIEVLNVSAKTVTNGSEMSIDILYSLKEVLNTQSYVVSGTNSQIAIALLSGTDGVDLLGKCDILSTVGFSGSFYGSNQEFSIKFVDEKRSVRIKSVHCCGCPAFIARWEEVWFALNEDDEDFTESKKRMTDLLALIFPDESMMTKEIETFKPISVVA